MIDPKNYDIPKLDTIKYVERTKFIQSILGPCARKEEPLENIAVNIWEEMQKGSRGLKARVDLRTVDLARDYIKFRDQGARLPKFSKWAAGMFKDDKELAKNLAGIGKVEDYGNLVISGDVVDILRCADTPHFTSCLKWENGKGPYRDVPVKIAEECPGIAIAYIDDDAKIPHMRGRVWVHHAKRVSDKADCIVVCAQWAGSLQARAVVRAIKEVYGVPAYFGGGYGAQPASADKNAVAVNFVDCFTKPIHHDMYTWVKNFRAQEVVD